MSKEPFFRIMRFSDNFRSDFVLKSEYADDRVHDILAYRVIENDLKKLYEFIDPRDGDNSKAYSFKTYELLLRIATEIESNCKKILCANKYCKSPDAFFNMDDYKKIDSASKLSQYEVNIGIWNGVNSIILPFKNWGDGKSPDWYTAYNKVKHNRSTKFSEANLKNITEATAGLFAILFSQFAEYVFDPYQETNMYNSDEGNNWFATEGSLFSIKPFKDWGDEEKYDFTSSNDVSLIEFKKFDFDSV